MDFYLSIKENIATIMLFWLVFFFSIFLTFIYQKKILVVEGNVRTINPFKKNIWVSLIVILPSLLIGFRSYDVGADTINLVNGYLLLNSDYVQVISSDRTLFSLFQYAMFIVSKGSPTFYLCAMAFFTLFILVKALEKWSDKISMPLSMYIYYALFGMQLLNQSRQLLALSIFIFGVFYLVNRQTYKYILCIVIASLFHFTAFIGLFFIFLYFKKSYFMPIKNSIYYLLLIFSPLLIIPFLSVLKRIIPSSYSEYIEIASYSGAGLGILITIFPVIVPIILLKKYLKDHIDEYLVKISLLTYPLRFAGYYSYFLMRLSYFTSIFMIILIPIAISKINNSSKRKFFIILIGFIMMIYYLVHYVFVNAGGMFPYKFKELIVFRI